MLEIAKFPHPSLFEETIPVTIFGEELKILLDSMWETMRKHRGIGLAANQCYLPFRIFVMEGPVGRINAVNPVITKKSLATVNIKEGCLSSPGDFIIIPSRSEWIQLQYQDETGETKFITLKGIHAVCAIHECEHLDGKSFMDNKSIPKNIRRALKKKWGVK
jgi:peptide deformylase